MSPPRRTFGSTWWGQAWIDALEHRASLDPNRLPRGRTYARKDRVLRLAAQAGAITANVIGSRPAPYAVRIDVRQFTDAEWDAVIDAITARAGHAAALLDGELDPGVVEDARSVGVEVLPGPGDLRPHCSCPDWADPCKHSSAVCYLMADALDEDPFALFALRGMERDELLAEVRARRSGGEAADGAVLSGLPEEDAGMPAREAWRRDLGPLPAVPHGREAPGSPAPWPADPPAGAPFDAAGLRALVSDAARRAWAMGRGEGTSGLEAPVEIDRVRRAAALVGTSAWEPFARRARVPSRELAGQVAAWLAAGDDGLAILTEGPWAPGPLAMAAGRDALVEAGVPPSRIRMHESRITVVGVDLQLRLARDNRWWLFLKRSGRWEPAGPPSSQPDEVLDLSPSEP